MSFLQKFLKPKWQHKDAEIRKQALLALDKSKDQTVIEQLAKSDPDAEIRQIAVKRVSNAELLKDITQSDTDPTTREIAVKLLSQMIAGTNGSSLSEQQRTELLNQIDNSRILETVAREANVFSIRLAALKKLNKPSLWVDLAANDTNAEIRSIALQHISDKKGLERVAKLTKTKDKNIYHLAKTRLDAILKEEERPQRLKDEQKRIVVAIENLGRRGDWEFDHQQFLKLQNDWAVLEGDHDAEYTKRYVDASDRFERGYIQFVERNAEKIAADKAMAVLREQKQRVLDGLDSLFKEIEQSDFATADDVLRINEAQHQWLEQWDSIEAMTGAEQAAFDAKLRETTAKIRRRLGELEENATIHENLLSIERQLNDYEQEGSAASSHRFKQIERFFARVNKHMHVPAIKELAQNLESRIQKIQAEFEAAKETVRLITADISRLLTEQNALSQQGKLNDALSVLKKVRHELKRLSEIDPQTANKWQHRIREASKNTEQLNDWRRWAAAPKKQELIAHIESLIGSTADPHDIAREIQEARDLWQKLGTTEASKELWERFNEACNKAYEPCQNAFAKEAEERANNQQARETYLAKLENEIVSIDWNNADWKRIEHLQREARDEWSKLGSTDRKVKQQLNDRFHRIVDDLKTRIHDEWAKNRSVKEKIVNDAKSCVDDSDIGRAVEKTKDLQKRWKTVGRVSPKDERALWNEFKQACDSVFARRDQLRAEKNRQIDEDLEQSERIVEKIESISQLSIRELANVTVELKQLQEQWKNAPEIGKAEHSRLEKRYRDAIKAIEQTKYLMQKIHQLDEVKALHDIARFCSEVEQSRIEDKEGIAVRWEELKKANAKYVNILQSRFDNAVSNIGNSNAQAAIKEQNAVKKRELAVRYEILAEIDSPGEFGQDRINYQMGRLKQEIGQGVHTDPWEELVKVENEWAVCGLADDKIETICSQRRTKALQILQTVFVDELRDYIK